MRNANRFRISFSLKCTIVLCYKLVFLYFKLKKICKKIIITIIYWLGVWLWGLLIFCQRRGCAHCGGRGAESRERRFQACSQSILVTLFSLLRASPRQKRTVCIYRSFEKHAFCNLWLEFRTTTRISSSIMIKIQIYMLPSSGYFYFW